MLKLLNINSCVLRSFVNCKVLYYICNGKNVEKINGLGKDLFESGCEDQPLNERTTLQRSNQMRRN